MDQATSQSHYEALGIEETADLEQIRTAWKALVRQWHPDRFDDDQRDEAEERASRINEAYSVLRNPTQRRRYDDRLAYDRARSADDSLAADTTSDDEASAGFGRRQSWSGAHERATYSRLRGDRPWQQQGQAASSGSATAAAAMHAAAPRLSVFEVGAAIKAHRKLLAIAAFLWLIFIGWTMFNGMFRGPGQLPSLKSDLPAGMSSISQDRSTYIGGNTPPSSDFSAPSGAASGTGSASDIGSANAGARVTPAPTRVAPPTTGPTSTTNSLAPAATGAAPAATGSTPPLHHVVIKPQHVGRLPENAGRLPQRVLVRPNNASY